MHRVTGSDGTEIVADGRTVWINHAEGYCIGRFGRVGSEVHRTMRDQYTGLGECLECRHGPTGPADWRAFQAAMLAHYGVTVSDRFAPRFLGVELGA